jgi:decaprenylphospho-beta-D-ribofuranose 2-oxidase
MPIWATRELTGWGRVLHSRSDVARPERMAHLARLFDDPRTLPHGLLARGGGRSYGDAALNGGGTIALTQRLDRILSLDADSGTVVAEAGVTFGDLLHVLLSHGWMPTVMPGTGLATLGGGLAHDVHGKNHHRVGSFGQHIEWFDLRRPDGALQRVDATRDKDLFRATVGGLGLTGIVERMALHATPAPSNALLVRRQRIRNLDHYLEAFASAHEKSEYVVGWIDALAGGAALGRGVLEVAELSTQGVPEPPARAWRWPVDAPAALLAPWSVRLFNACYRLRVPSRGSQTLMHLRRFMFPLDGIHEWNRMYGRRGFHQFQCVVPFDRGPAALRSMLERTAASGQGSFLAVLKALGPQGVGHLSFTMPGYTLALDFPNAPGAAQVIADLERITLDNGGRTYLAKDSTLSPTALRRMYPELGPFESVLRSIDPRRRMRSDLARRLAILDPSRP